MTGTELSRLATRFSRALATAATTLVMVAILPVAPAQALSCDRSDHVIFPQDLPANGRIIVTSFRAQTEAAFKKRVHLTAAGKPVAYSFRALFKGNDRFYTLEPKVRPKPGSKLVIGGNPTGTFSVGSPLLPPSKNLQLRSIKQTESSQGKSVWGYTWNRGFRVTFDRNTAAKARNINFKRLIAVVKVQEDHPKHGRRWVSTAVPVVDGVFNLGSGLCSSVFDVTRWVVTGRNPKVAEVAAKVTIMDRAGHVMGRAQIIFKLPPVMAIAPPDKGAPTP